MRIFVVIPLLLLAAQLSALAVGDTNEFTLFKHQARRAAYEWRISDARILATPEWKIGSKKIPVSPDKAWRIVQDWCRKRGQGGAGDFVRMEIRSFDPSFTRKTWRGRCFYRIEFIPMQFDSMLAVVLMDGTVLEPRRIPDLSPEEIK
jgi:hypothetical protein